MGGGSYPYESASRPTVRSWVVGSAVGRVGQQYSETIYERSILTSDSLERPRLQIEVPTHHFRTSSELSHLTSKDQFSRSNSLMSYQLEYTRV